MAHSGYNADGQLLGQFYILQFLKSTWFLTSLFGNKIKNAKIIYNCDNQAVVNIKQTNIKGKEGNGYCRKFSIEYA